MNKLDIIFQNFGASQIDWNLVINAGADEIVLVVDLPSVAFLQEKYQDRLTVKYVNSFQDEEMLLVVRDYLKSRGAAHVKIFTAHEDSVIPCAKIREALHLEGPKLDDVIRFRDKLHMKRHLLTMSEYLPKYLPFDKALYDLDPRAYFASAIEHLGFPVFKKPTSKAGSVGAGILCSEDDFHSWAQTVPPLEEYELDEFITGDLYHCDVFVLDGVVQSSYVCRYLGPNQNYYEGRPIGSVIIPVTNIKFAHIEDFTLKVLQSLAPLANGMYHLELFETPLGDFKFIEVACRPPGGEIPKLYSKQFDLDVRAAHYVAQIYGTVPAKTASEIYHATLWFPKSDGNFVELLQPDLINTQIELERVAPFGMMNKSQTFGQRAAEALLSSPRWDDLDASFRSLQNFSPLRFLS